MLPKVDVVDTSIGRYLLFDTGDIISTTLRDTGTWDPLTASVAKLLLALDDRAGTIVDGGANVGAFSIPVATAASNRCRVLSFEVQRVVYYQLCGNVVLNALDNVFPQNVGLSDRCGRISIPKPDYHTDTNIGALCIDPTVRRLRVECGLNAFTDVPGVGSEEVGVVTLDSLGLDDVRLIKLDVEGGELSVLRGAGDTLKASGFPPILFEVWCTRSMPNFKAHYEELYAHIVSLGYHISIIGDLALAQHLEGQQVHLVFRMDENGVLSVGRKWVGEP